MPLSKALIISIRPLQWIKNAAIFVAIIFSGDLLTLDKLLPVMSGFIIFCGFTSCIYLINDVADQKTDQAHPTKKLRPIAAGSLSTQTAMLISLTIGSLSLIGAFMLSQYFFLLGCVYLITLTLYSLGLKNVVLIDALIVAFGFVLRIWAGGVIAAVPISAWLILCTASLALMISFGKRRAEYTLLKERAYEQRQVLKSYPLAFLDVALTSATATALIAYFLYTYFAPLQQTVQTFWQNYLPLYWQSPHWLMLSIPFAILAVYRYLFIIYAYEKGGQPELDVIRDNTLLMSILGWFVAIFFAIYLL